MNYDKQAQNIIEGRANLQSLYDRVKARKERLSCILKK